MSFYTDQPSDRLFERIQQAHSLSHILVGEGFDSFKTYTEDHQHSVLFLLSRLIEDLKEAYDQVSKEKAAERGNAAAA
jgi:hypothetical protein